MWFTNLSLRAASTIVAVIFIVALVLDVIGYTAGPLNHRFFFLTSFACVGYFSCVGALMRFVFYRKPVGKLGAIAMTILTGFGWVILMAVIEDQPHRPSILVLIAAGICYQIQRYVPKARLSADVTQQAEPKANMVDPNQ